MNISKQLNNLIKKGKIKVSIGIDCPPGEPRPDTVFGHVMPELISSITGKEKRESSFFGAWIWELTVDEDEWDRAKPEIKKTMDNLVARGIIRGAQWSKLGDEENDQNI